MLSAETKSASLLATPCMQSLISLIFSRQRYVLGDNAMHKMARSSVFLSGLGGLGVEIGKSSSEHWCAGSTYNTVVGSLKCKDLHKLFNPVDT